jgi:hypothetical protein
VAVTASKRPIHPMRRLKMLVIVTVAGVFVVLLAIVALPLSPLWPGPPLPRGATRLHIVTAAPHLVPDFACATALLGRFASRAWSTN